MVVKGQKVTLKERWQMLRQELKGMSGKEKLEHLWEYYKWVLGVLAGVVLIIAVIISSIISASTETILAGSIINVPVDPEGYVMLQDGYYEHAKTEGRQIVELTNMNFQDPYTTTDQTYGMNIHESVTAMISADVLDYVMYDDVCVPFFMDPAFFCDLRELFSQEELDAMGSAVMYLEVPSTGERIPIAINIRDTEFYRKHMELDRNIYLSFSVRLPRKEACKDFWYYIKGGKTDLLQTELVGSTVDVDLNETGREALTEALFQKMQYVPGDQRVELNSQSFLPPKEAGQADISQKVIAYVNGTMADGSADYLLCDSKALEQLEKANLLDLRQILSQAQLEAYGQQLVYDGEIPVAVDLSGTNLATDGLATYETVYLVFSKNTARIDICKELWALVG